VRGAVPLQHHVAAAGLPAALRGISEAAGDDHHTDVTRLPAPHTEVGPKGGAEGVYWLDQGEKSHRGGVCEQGPYS